MKLKRTIFTDSFQETKVLIFLNYVAQIICFVKLKVPKRENFLLAFFALSEPIWVGDLGTKQKKFFFSIWPLISIVFGFLPHTKCAANQKKNFS